MTTYTVSIEGQEINLPEDIAQKDELVKQALQPYFPEVANALISRETKDDVVTIKVVKRAGSKGGWKDLITTPESRNPLVAVYQGLGGSSAGDMPLSEILRWEGRITRAIKDGKEQNDAMEETRSRLIAAKAVPSRQVQVGF